MNGEVREDEFQIYTVNEPVHRILQMGGEANENLPAMRKVLSQDRIRKMLNLLQTSQKKCIKANMCQKNRRNFADVVSHAR